MTTSATSWPRQTPEALNAFYGDPDKNDDFQPDLSWEAANIIRIPTVYPMVLSYDPSKVVKAIAVHKKCADSLTRALEGIARHFSASDLLTYQLNQYGGGYNFRTMRGSNKLSTHSWGCAVDLAPNLNPLGKAYNAKQFMMPMDAVMIFRAEGWVWGGDWKRPDAMHFQAAVI